MRQMAQIKSTQFWTNEFFRKLRIIWIAQRFTIRFGWYTVSA